eukprot:s1492_g3.t1
MKFGCDESATTGYLEIFDFGRSALDWAPRNLKEEEQVLLAQGAGTWARPYELNIADPLLLGVAQSQGSQGPIGSQMIYSLVCAFNLFSRIVPYQELLDVLMGDEAPAFAVLQREVELSARRLSLQAAAQVQILRMSRCHMGEAKVTASDGSFVKTSQPAGPESFTDLVQQLPLEGAPAVVANNVEEELKKLSSQRCQTFGDDLPTYSINMLSSCRAPRLCLVLRAEKDRRLLRQSGESESGLKKPQGFFYTLRRSLLRFRAQRLLRWVRVPNAAAKLGISNLVVSLFFFMLILFEGMASVILSSTFSRLEIEQAIWLWMLFPSPLAPLSPLMGLAALLLRRPLFCRLQAHLSLMASINLAVVGFAYGQEGLLKPCLVLFLLHVLVCYFAAIYSGLEMSSADVQLAEDSGGDASLQSLRESRDPQHDPTPTRWNPTWAAPPRKRRPSETTLATPPRPTFFTNVPKDVVPRCGPTSRSWWTRYADAGRPLVATVRDAAAARRAVVKIDARRDRGDKGSIATRVAKDCYRGRHLLRISELLSCTGTKELNPSGQPARNDTSTKEVPSHIRTALCSVGGA